MNRVRLIIEVIMQRRVTMQDIAEKVQMSRATVSAVLGNKKQFASEKNKALILEAVAQMGYKPNLLARGLKNGRTYTIGLLSCAAHNEIRQQEMVCLTNLLDQRNYRLYVSYYKGENRLLKSACEDLTARGCDALIISGSIEKNLPQMVREITQKAVFIISRPLEEDDPQMVFYDYGSGVIEAIDYLVNLGHCDIRMIGHDWGTFLEDQRAVAFLQGLEAKKLNLTAPIEAINWGEELTIDFMRRFFLKHPACTAVLCSNDMVALKVIQVCAKMGIRVPQDFSVIGFDDINASSCSSPALTTIHQPVEQGAQEIFKLLMNMLEEEDKPVSRHLLTGLVVRESTDVPRKHLLLKL